MLEAMVNEKSCFVTLTYKEELVPYGNNLEPEDAKNWIKRLRKACPGTEIRYFLCGEYGENTKRPHFHAAVFGIGYESAELIERTWGQGFTFTGILTKDSAQYIAGYVTKKIANDVDEGLEFNYPEFARMSLKPGIGAKAMDVITTFVQSDQGTEYFLNNGDVPGEIRYDGKKWPIGRYLKRKLREHFGFEEGVRGESYKRYLEELRVMFNEDPNIKAAKDELGSRSAWLPGYCARAQRRDILAAVNAGKIAGLEARQKIYDVNKKGRSSL